VAEPIEREASSWPDLAKGPALQCVAMRLLLVSNQGSGSAEDVDPAAQLRAHGCDVIEVDIADAAGWTGDVERVVVAGGDGSVGCAARIALANDVPLAVIPAGTANDFARAMELPTDPEGACELAARGARTRDVDLGDLDGTPFVNVASLGVAPKAAEQAQSLKSRLKALAYPIGALLGAARTKPISVTAEVDGEPAWSGDAWQVMVASSGAFGGWGDTGKVEHGDGQLDLVVVPAGRGTHRLAVDAASLVRGELAQRDGVHHSRGSRIELVLRHTQQVVVDGELLDLDDRRLVATVAPGPLRVVVA
jgi:diacylglycerol kinase family enzyme